MKENERKFIEEIIDIIRHMEFPEDVKESFRLTEDNITAEAWFKILENDIFFKFIICPKLQPQVLSAPILAFAKHEETAKLVVSLASCYMISGMEDKTVSEIPQIMRFLQLENSIIEDDEDTQLLIARKRIYENLINWLEYNFQNYDELVQNAQLIKNLFNIFLLCSSKILSREDFQNLVYKYKQDLKTIFDAK